MCAARQNTHNRKIMAHEEGAPRRGTPTMTTRLQARQHALQQLDSEYGKYSHDRIDLRMRDPDNPVIDKLWKKQCILCHVGDMCEPRVRDHLLLYSRKGDDYAINCINAVCDGKPNALSAEHPILTTYIKNTYSREIVKAEVRIFTLPYLNTGDERIWVEGHVLLWINDKHVYFRDAYKMLRRVHVPGVLKNARVMTARFDGGRFRDYKHTTLRALHLTPKKRTK
jgi:hypothetical protein